MAPKRPPPLDPNLFKGDGPLAPGSAPLPPAPDTLHPEFIIDAHTFPPSSAPTEILNGLEESYPRPTVNHIVQVKLDVSAETAEDTSDIKAFAIHPTVLNLTLDTPPSIANIAKGAVDIIVPSTSPMTGKEWDLLDEAVNGLDGSWGQTTHGAEGEGGKEGQAPSSATVPGEQGKIVISGLLPPPLTITSTPLFQDETYHLYQARLAQLSLHSNVYLKVLPPVVNVKEAAEEAWWNDIKELERVLRLYLSPAIETFGTHRLIFGSAPALPLEELTKSVTGAGGLEQPVSSDKWYGILRKAITELGETQEAVDGIFGINAAKVYQLD